MKVDDINALISSLSAEKIQKVCILDNNSIEFLLRIENEVCIEEFFKSYDLVLLPKWVEAEVNDSIYRKEYIERLTKIESIKFYAIDEYEYLELIKGRDNFLFRIFQEVCRVDSRINGFINRRILKGKSIEDLPDYEEWLKLFYDEAFESNTLKNGRTKRKNAGETSMAVLAFIVSKFYAVEYVTVISQDGGIYEMIRRAEYDINSEVRIENNSPITFKSNDCIINEFYKLGNLKERINNEISKLRNLRKLKYTKIKDDTSVEERWQNVDNDEFLKLLEDNTVQIIF